MLTQNNKFNLYEQKPYTYNIDKLFFENFKFYESQRINYNWNKMFDEKNPNNIFKLTERLIAISEKRNTIIVKTSILINPKNNVNRPNYPYRVEISTLF